MSAEKLPILVWWNVEDNLAGINQVIFFSIDGLIDRHYIGQAGLRISEFAFRYLERFRYEIRPNERRHFLGLMKNRAEGTVTAPGIEHGNIAAWQFFQLGGNESSPHPER